MKGRGGEWRIGMNGRELSVCEREGGEKRWEEVRRGETR